MLASSLARGQGGLRRGGTLVGDTQPAAFHQFARLAVGVGRGEDRVDGRFGDALAQAVWVDEVEERQVFWFGHAD